MERSCIPTLHIQPGPSPSSVGDTLWGAYQVDSLVLSGVSGLTSSPMVSPPYCEHFAVGSVVVLPRPVGVCVYWGITQLGYLYLNHYALSAGLLV